ncbi:MAG: hypothetical protein Q9184_006774, partial [Pyrenodesmia sp. 2 TL-2023]
MSLPKPRKSVTFNLPSPSKFPSIHLPNESPQDKRLLNQAHEFYYDAYDKELYRWQNYVNDYVYQLNQSREEKRHQWRQWAEELQHKHTKK